MNKFSKVLESIGGTFLSEEKILDGRRETWYFDVHVESEVIYLKLDKHNDSFYEDIDVQTSDDGGKTKADITFSYVEV